MFTKSHVYNVISSKIIIFKCARLIVKGNRQHVRFTCSENTNGKLMRVLIPIALEGIQMFSTRIYSVENIKYLPVELF